MFYLPQCAPQWYLRLETNCLPVEPTIIKNALFSWLKSVESPRDSLIRVCYSQMVKVHENIEHRYNWYRDFKKVLTKWDCHEILNYDPDPDDYVSIIKIIKEINSIVEKIKSSVQEEDIVKMNMSNLMSEYKSLKTHIFTEPFLNYDLDWGIIKLGVQIRSNIPRLTCNKRTVSLNGMELIYKSGKESLCTICYLRETEDAYHMLIRCTAYNYIRQTTFKKEILPSNKPEFTESIKNMSEEKLKSMVHFTRRAPLIRDMILENKNPYIY